ncbi:MAG: asparaginase [Chloroflexi bacterium]|uniref:Asparaginase n=1 Tax=Candidatus Chlorohelix allophototropha TaxID=3003348 RepID=A0A8T7LZQ0_9CHLR|nr:asparaginase [Chloroflexota bacterium]WJW65963.1 asparaginase [Chloroflexota bacterium L227-S17]
MNLLANVMRGNIMESRHYGFIALADSSGRVLLSSGAPTDDFISFLRSSAKPLQAIPLIESGAADRYGLTDKELALACASHNGEPEHVETALGILRKAGLEPEYLRCGSDYPLYEAARDALLIQGIAPAPLFNNCSGKHAGMLLVCKHMGWELETYTEPDHPLQREIMGVVTEFSGLDAANIATGIDGCSVVCFGMSTARMATAFARLADAAYWEKQNKPQRAIAVRRIAAAMQAHSFMVGGTARSDTDLMNSAGSSKIFSKIGAEAVWCAGFPEHGIGLAFKIADGASRVHPAIMARILRQAHLLPEADIQKFEEVQLKPITNKRGTVVGEYLPMFNLQEWA